MEYEGSVLHVPSTIEYFECGTCHELLFTTKQIIAFNTAMDRQLEMGRQTVTVAANRGRDSGAS